MKRFFQLPRLCGPMAMWSVQGIRWNSSNRHSFQPFSGADEEELVKIIATKPRHVLRHVRQLVWRSRKRDLHLRATVTQLMVVVQDLLSRGKLDPSRATTIVEGALSECVRFAQHDIAHLLFRALLRFRKSHGCRVSVGALRKLLESYRSTGEKESMLQLARELGNDEATTHRSLGVAAYLFADHNEEAEALLSKLNVSTLSAEELVALIEAYESLRQRDKLFWLLNEISSDTPTEEGSERLVELIEVFSALFKASHRTSDNELFDLVFETSRRLGVPISSMGFASVLRMQMRNASSLEEVQKVEAELRSLGYVPDLSGNSVIVAAYARVLTFGDRASEEVMLAKVGTLMASVEQRVKHGDPELEVSSAHVRAIIRGYGAAGRPELLKSAWGRLQCRGVTDETRVFNELLKWFSLMGNVREVLSTKAQMNEQGVRADSTTYLWIFRALGKWYPRQANKFYSELKTLSIRPDAALYTTLVGVFGDLSETSAIEQIRSEVSARIASSTLEISPNYFAVLLRVCDKSNPDVVDAIIADARSAGFVDHDLVVTSILHAFSQLPDETQRNERMATFLESLPHWNTEVYNVLLFSHGKRNEREKVEELLSQMKEKGVEMNEVTFGTLVTLFGKWGEASRVAEVVEQLRLKDGGVVSASFYAILAATYSKLGDPRGIDEAWEDLQSSRLFLDTDTYNSFLGLYGKYHNLPRMQVVMDSMLQNVPPNPVTATTIVDLLGKAGRLEEMEGLIENMNHSEDTKPTAVTYHQAMNAYAKAGDVGKLEETHSDLLAHGFPESAVTFNILAEGYGRAHRFDQLRELLERRRTEAEIPMDEIGYCVVIAAYGRARLTADVSKIAVEIDADKENQMETMRKARWALVDAFCRCGETQAMQQWIDSLGELSHEDQQYLIAYYSRAQMMDRAQSVVTQLNKEGVDLNSAAINALARGYARASKFNECIEVLHKMRDRGLIPGPATALALSQSFLRAGLNEQAQDIIVWRATAKEILEDSDDKVIV